MRGGDGWRRSNDFDPAWVNPDQGPASPIGGAFWRITGPAGYDSGAKFVAGRDLHGLQNLFVPRAGVYSLGVWLRDEAGNETASSAASLPLRFDDVPPGVAFEPAAAGDAVPGQIVAQVSDAHSGPASGEIHYRRLGSEQWTELPAKFQRGESADSAALLARLPTDLAAGTYVFRADAVDAAGNTASTTRRVDGTEMTVRKLPGSPVAGVKRAEPARAKARIFARLRWRRPQRNRADGAVPRRRLAERAGFSMPTAPVWPIERCASSLDPPEVRLARRRSRLCRPVRTVASGCALPAGPSRRIAVAFPRRRGGSMPPSGVR